MLNSICQNHDKGRFFSFYHAVLICQALTNCTQAYVANSKSKILQIAVLDYFVTSMFTNTTFQFPEYKNQS